MADNFTCDKCGEEFDSKRGLHIHEGQVHDEEVKNTEESENKEENESTETEEVEEEKASVSESEGSFPVDRRSFQISTELALFSVFVLGIAVGLSSGLLVAGSGGLDLGQVGNMPADDGETDSGGSDGPTVDVSKIETEGQPVLGQEDAPVTMVVYEDLQCPFCKQFEEGAVQQIESNYVVDGEVKIIWKDFPLAAPFIERDIHPWATPGAETMECVYRQNNDAFWAVKDTVYSNQESLSTDNVESRIIEWAADEGIPESDVQSCLENGNPREEVRSDVEEAKSFDAVIQTPQGSSPFVSSTPSVVVYGEGDSTGEPIVGAQPYPAFQNVIDSKLES